MIGGILLVALATRLFLLQAYRVPSAAMEDSVLVGDYLITNKLTYGPLIPLTSVRLPGLGSPEAGDPIVVRFPHDTGREILKRCMAGPGQTVEIRNKILYVDGKRTVDPQRSKYVDPRVLPKESPDGVRDNYGPVTIPPLFRHRRQSGQQRRQSILGIHTGTRHRGKADLHLFQLGTRSRIARLRGTLVVSSYRGLQRASLLRARALGSNREVD